MRHPSPRGAFDPHHGNQPIGVHIVGRVFVDFAIAIVVGRAKVQVRFRLKLGKGSFAGVGAGAGNDVEREPFEQLRRPLASRLIVGADQLFGDLEHHFARRQIAGFDASHQQQSRFVGGGFGIFGERQQPDFLLSAGFAQRKVAVERRRFFELLDGRGVVVVCRLQRTTRSGARQLAP